MEIDTLDILLLILIVYTLISIFVIFLLIRSIDAYKTAVDDYRMDNIVLQSRLGEWESWEKNLQGYRFKGDPNKVEKINNLIKELKEYAEES